MDMIAAFQDTLELARERGADNCTSEWPECDYAHLEEMYNQMVESPGDFSEGKRGRWLGWAQGALASSGVLSLEEARR